MTKLAIGLLAAAFVLLAWASEYTKAQAAPLSIHKALAGAKVTLATKASHRQIRKRNRVYSSKRRYRKRLHRHHGYLRAYRGHRYYYVYPAPYYLERCRFLADCPCRFLAQC